MSEGIVKKGNRYFVIVEGDPDPVTGKRRRKWHSGYDDEESAKKARRRLLVDRDEGAYVDPDRQAVGQYFTEWLQAIRPTVRESTWHSYERNLRLHVSAHVGRVQLRRLDAVGLNALYSHLLVQGHKGHHGEQPAGLSPRTVRYVHTIVHRALKDAVRWGRLVRNVADAADPPRASTGAAPEVQAWSRDTLVDFLDRSKGNGDRYYPLWVLLATTGARRGEALGLRWSDVDLKSGRAAVRQTVIAVAHKEGFGTPKTAKGKRSVSLDPRTVSVLKEWQRHQLEEKMLLGAGYRNHDLIFPKPTGEPLHPERVSREFDRRVERFKLPRITLHGLRHTWATLALATGVHPKVVQERLGHSTIGVTLDLYSHTTLTLHDEAADLVAGQILG